MAAVTQNNPAITYVKDVAISVQGAGLDDGNKTRTGVGDTVTFFVDSAELNFSNTLEDHSQGQSLYRHMRIRKKVQSMSIERKPEIADALLALCAANEVFLVHVTAVTSGAIPEPFAITNGVAIIGDLMATLNAPSTGRITFEDYGTAWV